MDKRKREENKFSAASFPKMHSYLFRSSPPSFNRLVQRHDPAERQAA